MNSIYFLLDIEISFEDLMPKLVNAFVLYGPMDMTQKLYDAGLFSHKEYFVLDSMQSHSKLDQAKLMTEYIKNITYHDVDLLKKFLKFLREGNDMASIYDIAKRMNKITFNLYFSGQLCIDRLRST